MVGGDAGDSSERASANVIAPSMPRVAATLAPPTSTRPTPAGWARPFPVLARAGAGSALVAAPSSPVPDPLGTGAVPAGGTLAGRLPFCRAASRARRSALSSSVILAATTAARPGARVGRARSRVGRARAGARPAPVLPLRGVVGSDGRGGRRAGTAHRARRVSARGGARGSGWSGAAAGTGRGRSGRRRGDGHVHHDRLLRRGCGGRRGRVEGAGRGPVTGQVEQPERCTDGQGRRQPHRRDRSGQRERSLAFHALDDQPPEAPFQPKMR